MDDQYLCRHKLLANNLDDGKDTAQGDDELKTNRHMSIVIEMLRVGDGSALQTHVILPCSCYGTLSPSPLWLLRLKGLNAP